MKKLIALTIVVVILLIGGLLLERIGPANAATAGRINILSGVDSGTCDGSVLNINLRVSGYIDDGTGSDEYLVVLSDGTGHVLDAGNGFAPIGSAVVQSGPLFVNSPKTRPLLISIWDIDAAGDITNFRQYPKRAEQGVQLPDFIPSCEKLPSMALYDNTLPALITDGRLNASDIAAPVSINCAGSGVTVWLIDVNTSQGREVFRVDSTQIGNALAQAKNVAKNTLVISGSGVDLWALVSQELQVQANELREPHKKYNFVFAGNRCGEPTPNGRSIPNNTSPAPPDVVIRNPVNVQPQSGPGGRHIVRPGENLFRISLAYNVTVGALAQANNLSNPGLIYVGQTLIIPGGQAQASLPTTTSNNILEADTSSTNSIAENVPSSAININNLANLGQQVLSSSTPSDNVLSTPIGDNGLLQVSRGNAVNGIFIAYCRGLGADGRPISAGIVPECWFIGKNAE